MSRAKYITSKQTLKHVGSMRLDMTSGISENLDDTGPIDRASLTNLLQKDHDDFVFQMLSLQWRDYSASRRGPVDGPNSHN